MSRHSWCYAPSALYLCTSNYVIRFFADGSGPVKWTRSSQTDKIRWPTESTFRGNLNISKLYLRNFQGWNTSICKGSEQIMVNFTSFSVNSFASTECAARPRSFLLKTLKQFVLLLKINGNFASCKRWLDRNGTKATQLKIHFPSQQTSRKTIDLKNTAPQHMST